jgi:pimeloyl-ACP methyl ester carboxylesterase
MKNKYYFLYILLAASVGAVAQSPITPRDVLFLGGIGATSLDWHYFKVNIEVNGYKISALNPGPLGQYQPHIDPVATSADKMNALLDANNKTNVLGIGHDGGGIVLRKMANNLDTHLTGIILDGVPNQGSAALRAMIPQNGSTTSAIDDLISGLEQLSNETNNCTNCNILGAFKTLTDNVKSNSERYREYFSDHPTMLGLGLPNTPYAVLWGNANKDNYVLDRLLGSRANAASGTYEDNLYFDCIREKVDKLRQEIKNAKINAIFNSLTNFFNVIAAFQDVVSLDTNTKKPVVDNSKITSAIADAFQAVGDLIKDIQNINAQMTDLLKCELIRAVLNATWNLIVSGGYTATITTVTNTIQLTPEECCWQCFGEPDDALVDACLADCYNNNDCVKTISTVTTAVLATKPHDGLYSKEEQLLAGAANTYELSQTNHFQEQSWAHTYTRFQLLFDGQNMAFKVPK